MDILKTIQKPKKRLKPLPQAVLLFVASTDRPTAKKIADNYGISLRTARRVIAFLKVNGYIARCGNNRNGGYIINNLEDIQYE